MDKREKALKLIEKMCKENGLDRNEVAAKMNKQIMMDARELIDTRLDIYDPEYIKQTFQRVTGITWLTAAMWGRIILFSFCIILFCILVSLWGID